MNESLLINIFTKQFDKNMFSKSVYKNEIRLTLVGLIITLIFSTETEENLYAFKIISKVVFRKFRIQLN